MQEAATITVLVADDDPLVRQALRVFVHDEADLEVAGEATDGLEAVEAAESLQPDVVLMDLRMPHMSGVEATRRIASSCLHTRVLAVTTLSSQIHVVPALRAGASGYLAKDMDPQKIVQAIRDTFCGQPFLSPEITDELITSLARDPSRELPPESAAARPLTDRELSIVESIAQGKSNAEIAQHLFLSEATVKSYLRNIMQKWNLRDRVQVLIHAVSSNVVTLEDGLKR